MSTVGIKSSSLRARSVNTVRLSELMEEAQRLEIAARIRQLREESPYSQQGVADKLNITLRAYQKLEQRGTTRWERAEELAGIYNVTPAWIWSGKEKLPTPDVTGALGDASVHQKLDEILARFDLLEARLAADEIGRRSEPESRPSRKAGREATGR